MIQTYQLVFEIILNMELIAQIPALNWHVLDWIARLCESIAQTILEIAKAFHLVLNLHETVLYIWTLQVKFARQTQHGSYIDQ